MASFEELYEIAKNNLSEKRFYHSECVMKECVELAKIYGADVEKAKIAGILHDIAKEIKNEKQDEYIKKYGVELDNIEKESKGLVHAKLGAKMCEKDFGLDEEICNAIKYHTTGRENMSLLEKIVFVSDSISADRTYDDVEATRKLAKENLDEAIKYLLKVIMTEKINEEKLLHIDALKAFNYLISHEDKK